MVCNQAFKPGARHSISEPRVLAKLFSHSHISRQSRIEGRQQIDICCRHFNAGHPHYLRGESKQLEWLKETDLLNVQGPLLYSCRQEKRQRLQSLPSEAPHITSNSLYPVSSHIDSVSGNDPVLPVSPSTSSLVDLVECPSAAKKLRTTQDPLSSRRSSYPSISYHPSEVERSSDIHHLSILLSSERIAETQVKSIFKKIDSLKSQFESNGGCDETSLLAIIEMLVVQKLNLCSETESMKQGLEISAKEKESLECTISNTLRLKTGWSLEALSKRGELFFWTGFPDKTQFLEIILPALTVRRDVRIGQRSIQRNLDNITIADRTIWLFILLWRDLSIRELYCLVKKSGDYTKSYPSFVRLLKTTANLLGPNAQRRIELPTIEQWRSRNTSPFSPTFNYEDRLFMILDGTSLTICNPTNHTFARAAHVHYKSHKAYRYYIACLLDGTISYVSSLYPGVVPDDTMFTHSGLSAKLSEKYGNAAEQFGLMGDKGYVGIEPPHNWISLLTVSAEAELSNPSSQTAVPTLESIYAGQPVQRETPIQSPGITSTEVAKPRSIVEVTIGKIKRYRKLTSGHIRSVDDSDYIQNLVYLAVYVANAMISKEISLKGSDNLIMNETRST